MSKKPLVLFVLVLIVLSFSGCALLTIPGQIVNGTFSVLGKLFNIANKLPKPPPWVFF